MRNPRVLWVALVLSWAFFLAVLGYGSWLIWETREIARANLETISTMAASVEEWKGESVKFTLLLEDILEELREYNQREAGEGSGG